MTFKKKKFKLNITIVDYQGTNNLNMNVLTTKHNYLITFNKNEEQNV